MAQRAPQPGPAAVGREEVSAETTTWAAGMYPASRRPSTISGAPRLIGGSASNDAAGGAGVFSCGRTASSGTAGSTGATLGIVGSDGGIAGSIGAGVGDLSGAVAAAGGDPSRRNIEVPGEAVSSPGASLIPAPGSGASRRNVTSRTPHASSPWRAPRPPVDVPNTSSRSE